MPLLTNLISLCVQEGARLGDCLLRVCLGECRAHLGQCRFKTTAVNIWQIPIERECKCGRVQRAWFDDLGPGLTQNWVDIPSH